MNKCYRYIKCKPKWIPVNKKQPEKDGWYLTYTHGAKRAFKIYYWRSLYHSWLDEKGTFETATYWMPLPESPNENRDLL